MRSDAARFPISRSIDDLLNCPPVLEVLARAAEPSCTGLSSAKPP